MTKRILSLCLVLVLLLGVLAGCSKPETKTDDKDPAAQTDAAPETTSQYAYQPQYYDLPEDIQRIGTSCVSGDTLYFTASVPDGGKETYTDEDGTEVSYDTYSEVIFRFDLDTGECVKLDNYVAEPVIEDPDKPDGVSMDADGSMTVYNNSTNIQTMAPRRGRHDLALPPDQQLRGRRHGGRLHLRAHPARRPRHAAAHHHPDGGGRRGRDGQLALYLHQHHPLR